jgi:hypothetical protein
VVLVVVVDDVVVVEPFAPGRVVVVVEAPGRPGRVVVVLDAAAPGRVVVVVSPGRVEVVVEDVVVDEVVGGPPCARAVPPKERTASTATAAPARGREERGNGEAFRREGSSDRGRVTGRP